MTKKKNKLYRLITMTALAAVMILGMVIPALASPITNGPILGTEENPAEAAITKTLKMGEGVDTPEFTFTFEFTPVSVDGAAAAAAHETPNMPAIVSATVKFDKENDTGKTVNGVKNVSKETQSLFDGIKWPHAGVYIYTVKETQSVLETLTEKEALVFSQAQYKLSVYVANGKDGLYVAAIGAVVVAKDGEAGTPSGDKVDGRPGGDPEIEGDFSKIVFTNVYEKHTGSGDPKDYALAISKTVTSEDGSLYDFANREMYFDFMVTVTKSNANGNASQKYIAYILDENGKVVTSDKNYSGAILTDEDYGDYIEFSSGKMEKVKLKHGQWISFVDLEIGATYTVTELAKTNYIPGCLHTINGADPVTLQGVSGSSFSVTDTAVTAGDDRVDFINVQKMITPTGISLDDLPYLALIGVITLAMVGFIVLKSRRNSRETEA